MRNYSTCSKSLKLNKIATIRYIPEVIKNGKVITEDEVNYHSKYNGTSYSYIEGDIATSFGDFTLKLAIRKSRQKNKFWVHYVYINNKNISNNSAETQKDLETDYHITDVNDNVPQKMQSVKKKSDYNIEYQQRYINIKKEL